MLKIHVQYTYTRISMYIVLMMVMLPLLLISMVDKWSRLIHDMHERVNRSATSVEISRITICHITSIVLNICSTVNTVVAAAHLTTPLEQLLFLS